MKGIQNLSITFVNDNNRSARNKLSSMGGIMSSSEELMKEAQKAMPVIKDIVQAVDSSSMSMPQEKPPQELKMPTQNFMAEIGRAHV